MNAKTKKTIALAVSLLAGSLLYGQDAAAEAAQETVSIANPVKASVEAAPAAKPQAPAHKFEWKSEEAKKRLAGGQGADAARPEEPKAAAQKDGPPAWRLLVAFAVMGVLLYGLYLFLKKFGKKISGEEASGLKIVSKLRLDSRNSLALVQFHEEELLLSVNSAGGVQLLSKQAQIELAEAEGNAGKVVENDFDEEDPAVIFKGFGGAKISTDGVKTVKDGLQ